VGSFAPPRRARSTRSRHPERVAERTLTEREAFRAARYFLEQFNVREKSDALMLLIGWMEEGTWEHDPAETADPAQWHDWAACVDRVIDERTT
jgi:hypothetical protein